MSQASRQELWLTILLGIGSWMFFCSLTIADPDLWGHTLYGIRAIELGVLTEPTDPYSYTASGVDWYNHEWATEYEYGWLWSRFGNSGLLFWKWSLLGAMQICLTLSLIRIESSLGSRILLTAFTTLCLGNFVVFIRPQLVTFLLFPIFIAVLDSLWSKWSVLAWWLPPLIVIWVNHHGGFLAGVAMVGLYAALAWLRYLVNYGTRQSAVGYSWLLAACLLATFVNPYGIKLHEMLWVHLGTEQDVREWQAVWQVGFSWAYWAPFLILILAFGVHRKWRWVDAVVLGVVGLQALMHLRHVALLCLAEVVLLAPVLTHSLRVLFPQLCQRWGAPGYSRIRIAGVLMLVSYFFLLQVRGAVPLLKAGIAPWEIAVEASSEVPGMPTRAIRFLNDNDLHGNILTDYGWAQFVIWQTFPESLIGFDGRYRTVYNPQLEKDFLEFQRIGIDRPEATPFLDKHPTEIVLLPNSSKAIGYLQDRSDWKKLYQDSQAVIYLKEGLVTTSLFQSLKRESFENPGRAWEIFPAASKTGTKIAD